MKRFTDLLLSRRCCKSSRLDILRRMLIQTLMALVLVGMTGNESSFSLAQMLPPASASSTPIVAAPQKKDARLGVATTARASIVVDVASGQSLYEQNAHQPYPIASLTKLMTAMVFLDQEGDLDQEVVIISEDESRESKEIFPPNEKLRQRDLLSALLIGSVNTAGNTIARIYPGGRVAFVEAMNHKARDMGLEEAFFADPTGLDPHNHATAQDVARMLETALTYPEIRRVAHQERIVIHGRALNKDYTVKTTNLLLGSFLHQAPYEVIGAKTGSLPEAGFCLAQATRDGQGHEVIAVVLGSENHFERFQDVKALTFWAFDAHAWPNR